MKSSELSLSFSLSLSACLSIYTRLLGLICKSIVPTIFISDECSISTVEHV